MCVHVHVCTSVYRYVCVRICLCVCREGVERRNGNRTGGLRVRHGMLGG